LFNEGCSGWFTKTRFGRAHEPSSTPKFDELIIGHLAQTFAQFIADFLNGCPNTAAVLKEYGHEFPTICTRWLEGFNPIKPPTFLRIREAE
jgi:hypothetical protein